MNHDLSIKLNNFAGNDLCAICGERTDAQIGPALFVEGTWSLVCDQCGQKHAPQLVEAIAAYYSMAAAVAERQESRLKRILED